MKRIGPVVLIGVLVSPPLAAAQQPDKDDGGWSRAQQIATGRQVIIGVTGRQPLKYTLLVADADGVVVVKPTAGKLDADVQAALIAVGARLPEVLAGSLDIKGRVEVRSREIYRSGQKLMDLDAAIERIDRPAITDIRGLDTAVAGNPDAASQTRAKRALLGAAIGFGAGILPAFLPADCIDCRSRAILTGGTIGAGIGALIGWAGSRDRVTFYVAPKTRARTLDDVPWERQRLVLPPSLQGAEAARKPATEVRPLPAPAGRAKGSPWSVTF
jgi:hypothetical protein